MNLLAANFIFQINFPGLDLVTIQNAISQIETQYLGCWSLWSYLSSVQASAKRTLLEWNLVAWYLADHYPIYVTGIIADGAPLTEKTIGAGKGVSIKNRLIPAQDALIGLTSNAFGRTALAMLQGNTDRMTIF